MLHALRAPVVIFFVGLIFSASLAYMVSSRNDAEAAARFDRISGNFVNSLKSRMSTYITALSSTRNLMELRPELTSQEFSLFIQKMDFEDKLPGIQGIGYVRRMPKKQAMKALQNLGVTAEAANVQEQYNEMNLVVYVEPISKSVRTNALGMDLNASPVRREAMTKAVDLGEAVATSPTPPITSTTQNPFGDNIFLVFVPVYKKEAPTDTVQQRREAIQGFVYAGFRSSNLFSRVATDVRVQNTGIALEIFDGDSVEVSRLMYSEGAQPKPGGYQSEIKFQEANHLWTLRLTTPPDFGPPYSDWMPSLSFLVGLMGTLLVTGLAWRAQSFALKLELDIKERMKTEAQLRTKSDLVEFTSKVGLSLMSEQDLTSLVQMVTDTGTKLVGAEYGAFFYNSINESGEAFMLYTLSGAKREDFENFAMPRKTDIFKPTFDGTGIVRSEDITKDPRYGKNRPLQGMPKAHLPVRSYLSAPVISKSGKVLGGLFFGHSQPGIFTERTEKIVRSIAIQAAVAMENAALYRELNAARHEADAANHAKTMFLANISHEMRTPLGVMLGHAELGLDETDIERMRDSLRIIVKNGQELTQIIGDVLDLSKIEANAMQIDESSISCQQLIDDLLSSWASKAEAKGLHFEVQLDSNVPRTFKSDRTRVKQILVNLLSNAVKFTERGGIRLTVSFDESQTPPLLKFTVEDTGLGISPEHRPKLFKTFSQADSSITRRFGGNGLGLALSKQLARALRGDLNLAESELGKGSRFVLQLPYMEGVQLRSAGASFKEENLSLQGMKALIVDDSRDNQLLIQLLLRRLGVQSDVASNGAEGVSLALMTDYDMILMDLQMPVLDGYGALEKLQQHGLQKPVIAVSAHALKEEKNKALSKGFSAYLTKPIDRQIFLQTLADLRQS